MAAIIKSHLAHLVVLRPANLLELFLMATPTDDNPYAAPIEPSVAWRRNFLAERPRQSAFIWSGIGFWVTGLLLASTDNWINAHNVFHERVIFVFVILGPFATFAFSTVYSLCWQIRTRKVDLRPGRRVHLASGAIGFVVMLIAIGIIGSFVDWRGTLTIAIVPTAVILSSAVCGETARLVAQALASRYQHERDMPH